MSLPAFSGRPGPIVAASLLGFAIACGGEEEASAPQTVDLASACDDDAASVYAVRTGDLPPHHPDLRGEIVRCARDRTLPAEELGAALALLGHPAPAPAGGVTIYRLTYRTERFSPTPDRRGGLSAALLFVPERPRGPRPPIVVAGHGTVGLADKCAPSQEDPRGHAVSLGLAAEGFPVIAPDYAGFHFDPPSGWTLAQDEAYSLLDASRAARRLGIGDGVVLVGHSQGGHGVLAAQSEARRYGAGGSIEGVVGLAPFWSHPRSFGAILSSFAATAGVNTGAFLAFSLLYFYSHGELYDGPGRGTDMLRPALREPVREALRSECFSGLVAKLATLGPSASEIFDPAFAQEVGQCGLTANPAQCEGEAARTWHARFSADRPAVDPSGAPLLIWQGGADAVVTPSGAMCGVDKIRRDLDAAGKGRASATLTVCADPQADHGSITVRPMSWIGRWIAARTMGAAEPEPCAGVDALGAGGASPSCSILPPNTD
jgi:pimeloyl-ACP methyl ester carboxylesterase